MQIKQECKASQNMMNLCFVLQDWTVCAHSYKFPSPSILPSLPPLFLPLPPLSPFSLPLFFPLHPLSTFSLPISPSLLPPFHPTHYTYIQSHQLQYGRYRLVWSSSTSAQVSALKLKHYGPARSVWCAVRLVIRRSQVRSSCPATYRSSCLATYLQ